MSRNALQLATLFLATAPVTSGGEPGTANRASEFIGHMVVTATPERPFIGQMVVSAPRLAPVNALVADLGVMTVTAQRVTTFAHNDAAKAGSLMETGAALERTSP